MGTASSFAPRRSACQGISYLTCFGALCPLGVVCATKQVPAGQGYAASVRNSMARALGCWNCWAARLLLLLHCLLLHCLLLGCWAAGLPGSLGETNTDWLWTTGLDWLAHLSPGWDAHPPPLPKKSGEADETVREPGPVASRTAAVVRARREGSRLDDQVSGRSASASLARHNRPKLPLGVCAPAKTRDAATSYLQCILLLRSIGTGMATAGRRGQPRNICKQAAC